MQLKRLSGLLVIATILLTACSKKGPSYTQYIPKDASYVLALDVREMMGKLEKDSLTVENMMEVLKDSSNPSQYSEAMAIWSQFKDAGLDFEQKVFMAIPSIDLNSGGVDIQVLAGLKDAKKLEDFISKMPKAPKLQKDNDLTYAVNEGMIIGWNKDAVMILAGQKTGRLNYNMDEGDEPAATAPPLPGGGSQLEKMKKYFALKKEESIASVDIFNDLLGKKADIALFTNSASLAGKANPAMAMMPKVKELLEDVYSATTINFEDGKVVMEGDTYVGKKLAEILKQYTGPVIDMELVDPYPSNNVDGIAAFSFNPQLIPALLKETGFDALADLGLAQKGLTVAEIVKALKGDVAVMFSDLEMKQVEKTNWNDEKYMSTQPTAKMLVAVRIGDKAAFNKLVDIAVKEGMFVRDGNRLKLANEGVPVAEADMAIGIENDLLLFSTDDAVYKAYAAKSSKIGLTDDARSKIKGASIAMFFDAEKMMNAFPETMFDSTAVHEKNILARAKPLFKTLSFTTENFDGKKIHGTGEMQLTSGKNSLPQLVRFLMYVAEEMKMKENENRLSWDIPSDTTDEQITEAPAKTE